MIKRGLTALTALTALYLLFRIWQEVRRDGTETIVVMDGVNSDDDYYDRIYDRYVANRLPNGRDVADGTALAN